MNTMKQKRRETTAHDFIVANGGQFVGKCVWEIARAKGKSNFWGRTSACALVSTLEVLAVGGLPVSASLRYESYEQSTWQSMPSVADRTIRLKITAMVLAYLFKE